MLQLEVVRAGEIDRAGEEVQKTRGPSITQDTLQPYQADDSMFSVKKYCPTTKYRSYISRSNVKKLGWREKMALTPK